MNFHITTVVAAVAIISCGASPSATAAGFGPTAAGSLGGSWIEEADLRSGELGVGFRIGESAGRTLRLHLGYIEGHLEDDNAFPSTTARFTGVVATGAVAWRIRDGERADLWIGPGAFLSAVKFRDDNVDANGFGIFVTVGADVHMAPDRTWVLEAGLRHVCLDSGDMSETYSHDIVELIGRTTWLWGR